MLRGRVIAAWFTLFSTAALACAAPAASALPQFTAPFREWPSGIENQSLATADFDLDGRLDVVLAEGYPTWDLVFLRQEPDHTFTEAGRLSPPDPMTQLCVGDYDGDGELDVAGLGDGGNAVYAFYGDGAFGSLGFVARPAPGGSIFLATANLNGGSDDLVSVAYWSGTIQTYTGLSIPIGPTATYTTSTSPAGLGIGDVNHDGFDDVVLPTEFASVALVLYSDGGGDIAASQTLSGAPYYAGSACVADLNGDGLRDIAIGATDGTGVALYLQPTLGTFSTPVYAAGSGGSANFQVHAGDLDGDGDRDLTLFGPQSWVVRNDGGGLYSVPNAVFPPGVHGHSRAALADFDGDGKLDVLGYGSYGAGLLTARGNGDCTFESDTRIPFSNSEAVVFFDRDHDGDEDAVSVNDNMSLVEFYDRVGQTLTQYDASAASGPLGIVAGDFNHDGWQDVATIEAWGGNLAVYLNDGAGGYPVASYLVIPTGEYPRAIAAGDLDDDGFDDLVLACGGGIETRARAARPSGWPYNHGVMVFFSGSAGFAPPQFVPAPGECPNDVTLGDLDGDGRLEIVASLTCGSSVMIVPCTNLATLGAPVSVPVGNPVTSAVLADFDTDTDLDLLVLASQGQMGLVPNLGSLSFGTPTWLAVPQLTNHAVAADFDQDGFVDVAALSHASVIAVFPGLGAGVFGTRTDMGTGPNARAIVANDFDHDGDVDLLVGCGSQAELQFHRNGLFATSGVPGRPPVGGVLAVRPPAPNPAHGPANVEFALASAARVAVEVLDVSGRLVNRLSPARTFAAGTHSLRWDLRGADGRRVASGVYFVRVSTPGHDVTRKLLVTQ